ncbi:MAG: hypothetical protein KGH56_03115 [Patescibacteria group bacterium]|nr:hypothetical protein [Patescibacteria group bacterium]
MISIKEISKTKQHPETEKRTLFEEITTIEVPKISSFLVSEKFCAGRTIDGVKIEYVGPNFMKFFFGKREEVPKSLSRLLQMKAVLFDREIFEELPLAPETLIAHLWFSVVRVNSNASVRTLNSYSRDIEFIPRLLVSQRNDKSSGWRFDALDQMNQTRRPFDRHFASL